MRPTTYLVFGDLHGRILPAFRLASVWAREHDVKLDGLLQVGDLGYFPDPGQLDKATKRHAEKDPMELGAALVAEPSRLADEVFADPHAPGAMWFTVGNHEDYRALSQCSYAGDDHSFPVDHYLKVRCVRDGRVATLPGGVRVGALWGIDDRAPNARRKIAEGGRIRSRSATQLAGETFDVLLTHDSPRDAIYQDSGSLEIDSLLGLARPSFLFFGHYSGTGRRLTQYAEATQVCHLSGFELRGKGGTAEEGSVGLLRFAREAMTFEYLDLGWLRTFTRHNWRSR
jgi:hypothetical protein